MEIFADIFSFLQFWRLSLQPRYISLLIHLQASVVL